MCRTQIEIQEALDHDIDPILSDTWNHSSYGASEFGYGVSENSEFGHSVKIWKWNQIYYGVSEFVSFLTHLQKANNVSGCVNY